MEDKKTKILVIDDEPEIVDILKNFLSRKGYDVSGALSGEEALNVLEQKATDLILLDMKMAGMGGSEVARIVKEKYPQVKIIVVTAHSEESQSLSKDHLLEDVLLKPISLQQLYSKLLEIVKKDEIAVLNVNQKQGVKARVLLIKAKILFLEPSIAIYKFLDGHFKSLNSKGEEYQLDIAANEKEFIEKLVSGQNDILAINASSISKYNNTIFSKVLENNLYQKEIILYNIKDLTNIPDTELERLTKSVEIACIKNGLVEIKWVEI